MAKVFNALNGKELEALILKEVAQQIALDPRFDSPAPVRSCLLVFTLRVDWYPGGETPITVSVSHVFRGSAEAPLSTASLGPLLLQRIQQELDGDIQFSAHLTYPKVTYQHVIDLTLTRPDGGTVSRGIGGAVPPEARTVLPADRLVDLRASATPAAIVVPGVDPQAAAKADRIARLRAELAAIEGSGPEAESVAPALAASEPRHRDFEPFTGTGLRLTYGFQEGPGPEAAGSYGTGAAVGQLQTADAIEAGLAVDRIALGVTHPPLDAGGIGAPDLVRREAGLPVPQKVTVRGQTVDVPLGTF